MITPAETILRLVVPSVKQAWIEEEKWGSVLSDPPRGAAEGMCDVRSSVLFVRHPVKGYCEIANKLV